MLKLDEEGQTKDGDPAEGSERFQGNHSIHADQLVELQQRKQANDKKNNKVRPRANANPGDNPGGAQQPRNNSLSQIIVFAESLFHFLEVAFRRGLV